MYEDLITYRMRKVIYSVIFNFYENDYEDAEDFDLYTVESLRNVVEYLASEDFLSERVKDNIHNYLTRARDFKDDKRSKRIELINDTIGFMNKQDKDDSLVFYRIELYKRRRDYKYIIGYSNEEVINQIEAVHDSICNDLYVVVSHTDITDKETFETEYLPLFKDTNIYYESLNNILYENPRIFKDELFYSRMMQIINYNKELYKDDKQISKMNNKLLKKINKAVKKVK